MEIAKMSFSSKLFRKIFYDYKKSRDANFSPYEKELIIKLVSEKIKVIENKKTDSISNRQKAIAWDWICGIVNAKCGTCRTSKSLRIFWDNLKRRSRRQLNDIEKSYKTDMVENNADDESEKESDPLCEEQGSTKVYDWNQTPEFLRELISNALKSNETASHKKSKKPLVLFMENSKTVQDIPSLTDEDESLSAASVSDIHCASSYSLEHVLPRTTSTKRKRRDNSAEENDEVKVKHVAVSTETENLEEKRKEDLHSLLLKEKRIQIEILELDLMRKKLELEKDFPGGLSKLSS